MALVMYLPLPPTFISLGSAWQCTGPLTSDPTAESLSPLRALHSYQLAITAGVKEGGDFKVVGFFHLGRFYFLVCSIVMND